jgi:acetyltransferase
LLSARKLTPEEIRRLTRIDYEREMAFVAVTGDGGQARLLGVARYVRDAVYSGAEAKDANESGAEAREADSGGAEASSADDRGAEAGDADDSSAEFAMVVADAWQRKGVGTLLLSTLLRHAHAAGIGRLHGITLASNRGMQNLAHKFGFVQKHDPQDASIRYLEKTLATGMSSSLLGSSAEYPGTAAANDEGIV